MFMVYEQEKAIGIIEGLPDQGEEFFRKLPEKGFYSQRRGLYPPVS
jgi:hypothetical protein